MLGAHYLGQTYLAGEAFSLASIVLKLFIDLEFASSFVTVSFEDIPFVVVNFE